MFVFAENVSNTVNVLVTDGTLSITSPEYLFETIRTLMYRGTLKETTRKSILQVNSLYTYSYVFYAVSSQLLKVRPY